MFLYNLFEDVSKQLVVIFPGRFQPFHHGHKATYDYLTKSYGKNNVYICTSGKVESTRSPFTFQEKLEMMQLVGIDPNKIVESPQPYQPRELLARYDTANTVLLFAVSEKDMADDPRFQFTPKKDGSLSYFQQFLSLKECKPASEHGYITIVPTFRFNVLEKPMHSASEVRTHFANANNQTKKAIVKDLFGVYTQNVFNLMKSKLRKTE